MPSSDIHLAERISAPDFFEDPKNMFLAEGKTAKQYHINALKRWKIPYLLSYGHKIDSENLALDENFDDVSELEELEEI